MATVVALPRNFLLSENEAAEAGRGMFEPRSLMVKIKPEVTVSVDVNERVKQVVRNTMEATLDAEAKGLIKSISGVIGIFLKKDPTDVEGVTEAVNRIVDNSAEPIARMLQKDVEKALAKEAKQDQHLKEAKVKAVFKAASCAAKMTQAAIRVAATGGADVHAWYQLASSISDAAEMVMEALKTEEKFLKELQKERNDLEEKFKALEKSRREVEQASGLSAVFPTLEKAGRWVIWHKQCGTTEESRVKYRNSVYSTRKDIDKIAEPLKKLETKMKQAPDLKQGVALGAKVMVLKRQVRLAVAAYDAKIKNLEELAQDLAALGATIDDRTLVEKFKSIPELVKSKNFKELASTSKDCFDAVKEIYDTCKEIKELVGEIVELAK